MYFPLLLVPVPYLLDSRGSTFTQMNGILRMAHVNTVSENTYYEYQATYVLPAISLLYEASVLEAQRHLIDSGKWERPEEILINLQGMKTPDCIASFQYTGRDICLAADGRFDSPGNPASRCSPAGRSFDVA